MTPGGLLYYKSSWLSILSFKINKILILCKVKSFFDQACLVEMVGYWSCSFFSPVFMDLDFVHLKGKKELGQNPAILTS